MFTSGYSFGQRLKIRITYKSIVRPTRSGQVFNVHGMDSTSEIGMVCFGNGGIRLHEELKVKQTIFNLKNPFKCIDFQ